MPPTKRPGNPDIESPEQSKLPRLELSLSQQQTQQRSPSLSLTQAQAQAQLQIQVQQQPPSQSPQQTLQSQSQARQGPSSDFSSVIKSRMQSHSRTGQACDRCKVRKIRCDALPEGCSHCINQNLECRVTDRVTGRSERRGYMQQLEREKADMLNHMRDLEKLLDTNGLQVRPWNGPGGSTVAAGTTGSGSGSGFPPNPEEWTQTGNTLWVKKHPATKTQFTSFTRSPSNLELRPADVHLGVHPTDQARLSSIYGTSLSILGSTIDLDAFAGGDMDEPAPGSHASQPLYNKSIQALYQSTCNVNPQVPVDYPTRADAFTYAEWYFLMIYPFLPVLHKPTFMTLLARLYDDPNFKPTVAEVVMVHMVFASIYLQYGIRNQENPEQKSRLNELSNKHYHFSLSKFFDLATSRTFADLQALALVAAHTRSFPKPNCSSMMSWYCCGLATELGLHRATKKPGEGTNLGDQMRKRVWWTVVEIGVALNGRMGRPMPIRLEEVDVDFPEAIPDELLMEDGVDTSRTGQCQYEIGILFFKMSALFAEMYSNLYCARRDPRTYLAVLHELEDRLRAWRDELPEPLRVNIEASTEHSQVFALYAELCALEFQLCVRHPAVAMTNDARILAENKHICEQTAKAMLNVVHRLYKLKSLDTTWYCLAVYIAAIFSSLASHWERRHDINPAEVAALRDDMNTWLVILGETGTLMGSGMGLRDAVSSIIDRTMAWIEHDRESRTSASAPPPVSQQQQVLKQQTPPTPPYANIPRASSASHAESVAPLGSGTTSSTQTTSRGSYYPEPASESATYPPLAYTDPSAQHYDTDNQYLYAQTAGPAHVQVPQQAPAQSQAQAQVAAENPLTTFATQATQDIMWRQQAAAAAAQAQGGNGWQDWTAAIVDNQDRYSASALMALGGPRPGNVNDGNAQDMGMGVSMSMNVTPVTTTSSLQWPLLLFDHGTGVSGACSGA